jgi:peptide-methionine (S)-S-oxide reductase
MTLLGCGRGEPAPAATPPMPKNSTTAIFAGGCFWCMEPPFEKLRGVTSVVSGYTGGTTENPTYEQVSAGNGEHYEAVEVTYDPSIVSYAELLEVFWRNVDPTDLGGQFCDRGPQYRAAIFVANESERAAATRSLREVEKRMRVTTPILPAARFWPAEDYHQDYAAKNPVRYKFYRTSCGRDARLRKVWGS